MTIENSYIRRQVLNQRFVRRVGEDYLDEITGLFARVVDRIEREPNNARLSAIASDLTAVMNRRFSELGLEITEDMKRFAGSEIEFINEVVNANSKVLLQIPDADVVNRALDESTLNIENGPGAMLASEAINEFSAAQIRSVQQIITDGILLGDSIRDIASAIRALGTGKTKAQTMALTRTLVNHTSAQARKAFLAENEAVFDGDEWIAVLDQRTTLVCGGRDGTVYTIGAGPYPPAHFNCRSLRVPVMKSDFTKTTQKSKREDFDAWLRDQDADFQNEYFSQFADGAKKAKLFRQGKLPIQRFRDETGRNYTLEELRQLNPVAFDKANLTTAAVTPPAQQRATAVGKPKGYDKADGKTRNWIDRSFTTTDYNGVFDKVVATNDLGDLKSGAYYAPWNQGINMGRKTTISAGARNTYRHEFGHHVDYTMGEGLRSGKQDFISAMTADRDIITEQTKALIKAYKSAGLTSRRRGFNAVNEISINETRKIYIEINELDFLDYPKWVDANLPAGTMQRALYDAANITGAEQLVFAARLKHSIDMNSELLALQGVWENGRIWKRIDDNLVGITGLLDNIFALSKGWGGGHTLKYYKERQLGENKEIFANTFAAMDPETSDLALQLYKSLTPKLYDKMKEIIND